MIVIRISNAISQGRRSYCPAVITSSTMSIPDTIGLYDSQYGDDRDQDKTEEHLTVMFLRKRIEPLKCSHKSNPYLS